MTWHSQAKSGRWSDSGTMLNNNIHLMSSITLFTVFSNLVGRISRNRIQCVPLKHIKLL
jgi:hypothetical protein